MDYFDLKTTPESYELAAAPVQSAVGSTPYIDEATMWTLEQESKHTGVPLETVIAEWPGHEINEVTDQIATSYPEIFVKTVVAPEESGLDYDVVFTKRPPEAVFELLSTVPRDLQVRYGAPLSMGQAMAAEKLAHRLLATQFGTEFLTSFSDSRLSTTVTLGYSTPGADAGVAKIEDVAAFVSEVFAPFTLTGEAPVVIASRDEELEKEREFVAMQGGRNLNTTDGGVTYICTSGFGTRRQSTGNDGLITAPHCKETGGGMQYESSTGALGGPVHVGASDVDMQFNKAEGANTATAMFKVTSTATYTASSASNPIEGDDVSKYGRTTGNSQGVVVDPNTCNSSATWCKLLRRTG